MNATLEGKRIAIVGGTTGLGLSAAQALVTRGAWVAVSGRSPESLERALSLLGERALGVVGMPPCPAARKRWSPSLSRPGEGWMGSITSLVGAGAPGGRTSPRID
ncbi:MAG: SDR family NAD(P)-dependent oxidoreductase [Verrucomicrobiales bacterium]